MSDIEQITLLRFKMSVAFAVHHLCDKDRLGEVCLEEFLKKNRMYNFNEKLISTLTVHNINESNFLGHSIGQLVIDELEKFYDFLSKEDSVVLAENQPSN